MKNDNSLEILASFYAGLLEYYTRILDRLVDEMEKHEREGGGLPNGESNQDE